MSLDFVVSNGDAWSFSSPPCSSVPLSFSAWIKTRASTNGQVIVCLGRDADSNFSNRITANASSDVVQANMRSTSTASATSTGIVDLVDTWHHVLGVFNDDTVRDVYLDGGNFGTQSTAKGTNAFSLYRIGSVSGPSGFNLFDGLIAEVATWDMALSAGDAVALAGGALASTIEAANLVSYRKLIGTEDEDLGTPGASGLTITGAPTASADQPPVDAGASAPVFSVHPSADTVTEPAAAGFGTVVASDTTSWQWEAEDSDQSNTWSNAETVFVGDTAGTELTDTLVIDPTEFGDTRRVRVVATGAGGSTISTPTTGAQLTVNAAAGGDTDSRPITLSPPADTIVINAMTTGADAAVTTDGSVFDSDMIIVEPNMQASIKAQIAVTGGFADMTLEANGVYGFSYSGGAVDQAFDIDVTYYSPSTKQMSLATITTIPV